jgi:hypothetical protein
MTGNKFFIKFRFNISSGLLNPAEWLEFVEYNKSRREAGF